MSTGYRASVALVTVIALSLLWTAGCTESDTVECPWGATCPTHSVCHEPSQTCVPRAQVMEDFVQTLADRIDLALFSDLLRPGFGDLVIVAGGQQAAADESRFFRGVTVP